MAFIERGKGVPYDLQKITDNPTNPIVKSARLNKVCAGPSFYFTTFLIDNLRSTKL